MNISTVSKWWLVVGCVLSCIVLDSFAQKGGQVLQQRSHSTKEDAIPRIAHLIHPEKTANLRKGAITTWMNNLMFYIWKAEQEGIDAGAALDRAFQHGRIDQALPEHYWDPALVKKQILSSYVQCEMHGVFESTENLERLKRGRAAWTEAGDKLEVDHRIPQRLAPELRNNYINLQMLPQPLNGSAGKWDKITTESLSAADDFAMLNWEEPMEIENARAAFMAGSSSSRATTMESAAVGEKSAGSNRLRRSDPGTSISRDDTAAQPAEMQVRAGRTSVGVKTALKAAKIAGPIGAAMEVGVRGHSVWDVEQRFEAGELTAAERRTSHAENAGGMIGGISGAAGGAAAGAAIGAPFGGVGAIPGAIIGGIVGGVAGDYAGSRAGRSLAR